MIGDYVRRKDLDNSDHKFAEFLKKRNWKGDTASLNNVVKYIDPKGNAIVIAIYNNRKCSYEVYAVKGANDGPT